MGALRNSTQLEGARGSISTQSSLNAQFSDYARAHFALEKWRLFQSSGKLHCTSFCKTRPCPWVLFWLWSE